MSTSTIARFLVIGGGLLFGCSASVHSAAAPAAPTMADAGEPSGRSSGESNPEEASTTESVERTQPSPPFAPGERAQHPRAMHLVAVTDASEFVLRPRVVGDDEIVVPLPPQRDNLADVEVGLLVTRRDTGEIMNQQNKIYNWKTRGAALQFYLPPLPGADYVAEIRTTSTIRMGSSRSSQDIQLSDKSQVTFQAAGKSAPPRSQEFDYHFELHHVAGESPRLIKDDYARLGPELMRIETILSNNTDVTKVTLDCWASSDGETVYNMQVSLKRCAWINDKILQPAVAARASTLRSLNIDPSIEIIEAAHGEDNPPVPEPAGVLGDELQRIQQLNRIVVLTIYFKDGTTP